MDELQGARRQAPRAIAMAGAGRPAVVVWCDGRAHGAVANLGSAGLHRRRGPGVRRLERAGAEELCPTTVLDTRRRSYTQVRTREVVSFHLAP